MLFFYTIHSCSVGVKQATSASDDVDDALTRLAWLWFILSAYSFFLSCRSVLSCLASSTSCRHTMIEVHIVKISFKRSENCHGKLFLAMKIIPSSTLPQTISSARDSLHSVQVEQSFNAREWAMRRSSEFLDRNERIYASVAVKKRKLQLSIQIDVMWRPVSIPSSAWSNHSTNDDEQTLDYGLTLFCKILSSTIRTAPISTNLPAYTKHVRSLDETSAE